MPRIHLPGALWLLWLLWLTMAAMTLMDWLFNIYTGGPRL